MIIAVEFEWNEEKNICDENFVSFASLSMCSGQKRRWIFVQLSTQLHDFRSVFFFAEFSNEYSSNLNVRPGHQMLYDSFSLPIVNDILILLQKER